MGGRTAVAFISAVLAFFPVMLLVPAPCAQVSASLFGTVSDPSGAAVSGATVTAKNVDTGFVRSTTTDAEGRYALSALPVGRYQLSAQKSGFAEEIRKGIQLAVGQDAGVDLVLHVGAASEQLTVVGDAPAVSVTTQDISGLVTPPLPTTRRGWFQTRSTSAPTGVWRPTTSETWAW